MVRVVDGSSTYLFVRWHEDVDYQWRYEAILEGRSAIVDGPFPTVVADTVKASRLYEQ